MSATLLFRPRVIYAENAFAELVLWRLRVPVIGSTHRFKYRLAFVADGACVLRFDNEAGKGEHWHEGVRERLYQFTTPEQLLADPARRCRDSPRRGRAIREAARRVERDVKAVHSDVTALLNAGILKRTDAGGIVFPFDAVQVEFTLRAA